MKRAAFLWAFAAGLIAGVAAGVVLYRHAMLASPRNALAKAGSPAAAAHPAQSPRPGTVVVDPAMLQVLGVRTALAEQRTISTDIRTTGYVDYDQERVTQVNARFDGWVQKLYIAYVGQKVRRGQPLLTIYSPDLMMTQEDYLRSRQLANREAGGTSARIDANNLMSAAEARLKLLGIAPSEVRKLAERGSASQAVPLEAPSSGVITDLKVVEGSYVKAGASLYTIADLARVWVYADVYERELPMAQVGQHATVTTDALPGKSFEGKVTYIYPVVNEQTRTVRLRLEFANPGNQLRPGMYVKVTLLAPAGTRVLAVPAEAVLNSGVRNVVIVALGHGHFEPRVIEVGPESSRYVSVLSGLREGERVVTSAQFLIDSESNLNETLSAMTLNHDAGAHADVEQGRGH